FFIAVLRCNSSISDAESTVSHSKYFKIDVLDIEVSAGPGVINREFVEVLRSVEYSFDDARHMFDGRKAENIRIINVRGDSMSGTIEPGDLLFVDITVERFNCDI
ncbi:S24 family peptidase, partial [Escherichia sp. TWPC-MK]